MPPETVPAPSPGGRDQGRAPELAIGGQPDQTVAASSDPAGPGSREIVLRPAEAGDAPAMRRLAITSHGKYVPRMGRAPAPMADDYAAVVVRGHAWVAEHGDQLVGLLVMRPAQGHLLLENIAVAPSAQNLRLGSRLLRLAEQHALAMGLPEIRLYTNPPVRRANLPPDARGAGTGQ
jgi:N-acetylglutamate synthase-like GNAT family acetyltransferase